MTNVATAKANAKLHKLTVPINVIGFQPRENTREKGDRMAVAQIAIANRI